ncbi:MAG: MBL fold metallo-hydrolase [Candidatus Margulisiibacteriota bacterium]
MAKIKFWGVQGSTPGSLYKDNLGSNTPCVSIETDENLIILDSGTGIRHLSKKLNNNDYKHILLLITHSHWDHIQGFPFFDFLHADRSVYIYSHNKNHLKAMLNQVNGINFPLNQNDIKANLIPVQSISEIENRFEVSINTIQTNHHGDCIGYRIRNKKFDVCFLPDNQLHNPSNTSFDKFVEFCKDSQLLIHDGQYTEKDMPEKKDWGHSIIQDAHRLCIESNSKSFVFFHHDPEREKSEILEFEKKLN